MEILTFILVSMVVIALPGPNVITIVSTSLSHGKQRGLQTMLGVSAAMAIQLLIAALATSWFVSVLTTGFMWLKWAGVIYLVYLGIRHLLDAVSNVDSSPLSATGSFRRGFFVSLTNPKTILFFTAFLPQFVSAPEYYVTQIVALSIIFWVLAIGLDSVYAVLAGTIATWIESKTISRYQTGVSGLLYLGAGAALVVARSE